MVEREGGAEERLTSPFVEMIGGRLDEWREGYVRMSLTLEPHHTNPHGPPFLNAACRFETGLEPRPLLRFLKSLEHELGRRPGGEQWGPRPIDLDILLYGDRLLDEEGLVVPHPRLAERPFVLAPLAEIAADVKHPAAGKSVAQFLEAAGEQGVRRVAGAGWEGLEGMAAEKLRL